LPDDLTPGLHEALVTEALRIRIERAREEGWLVEWTAIDDATLVEILARHIHDRVRDRIGAIPNSTDDRRTVQIDLANRVLEVLAPYTSDREAADAINRDAWLLTDVDAPLAPGRSRMRRPRPGIPLRTSGLLVNGHNDLQIGTQVGLEIQSANKVDLVCAFVRWAGLRLIRRELERLPKGSWRLTRPTMLRMRERASTPTAASMDCSSATTSAARTGRFLKDRCSASKVLGR
jgi:hypothetical protein